MTSWLLALLIRLFGLSGLFRALGFFSRPGALTYITFHETFLQGSYAQLLWREPFARIQTQTLKGAVFLQALALYTGREYTRTLERNELC